MSLRHGGKRHPKTGKSHRFPVPPDGAPVGGLHRLQPRSGTGGAASGPVPPHLSGGHPKIQELPVNVWGIDPAGKADEELAAAGVEALADFIKEMGLPTTFAQMGISPDTDYKAIADSCSVTAGCCKKLTRGELLEIFLECR